MHALILLSLMALATFTIAQQPVNTTQFNTTQEFLIKTRTKPSDSDKCSFDNLYLTSYHTGAGQSDPVFTNDTTVARPFFLSPTNMMGFQRLYYEAGNNFPWTLQFHIFNSYAAWQPVALQATINVATGGLRDGEMAFYLNETGLQWDTAPGIVHGYNEFSGWFGKFGRDRLAREGTADECVFSLFLGPQQTAAVSDFVHV